MRRTGASCRGPAFSRFVVATALLQGSGLAGLLSNVRSVRCGWPVSRDVTPHCVPRELTFGVGLVFGCECATCFSC